MVVLLTLLRRRSGSTSLEFLVTLPALLSALALLMNCAMYCINLSTATGMLNRLRNDVAVQSCLPNSEKASVENGRLLLTDTIRVEARAAAMQPGERFDRSAVANPDGTPRPLTGASFASCIPKEVAANGETTDVVAQNGWIWLHLSYQQHFLLGPTITVQRTVLAISTSFRSGN
jgi:hypothetical protein